MKKLLTLKRVLLTFIATICLFSGCLLVVTASATAAEMIVRNTLDNKITIAVLYFDRSSGLWTTEGWWGVNGNSDRSIKIPNIDANKGMYYYAYSGKNNYVDRSTLDRDRKNRWISSEVFEFDFDGKPSNGRNLQKVLFYKSRYSEGAGAFVVTIDTKPVG